MKAANFLVIGHLNSINDIYMPMSMSIKDVFLLITPNSYKFLESYKYYRRHHKIKIYIKDIFDHKRLKINYDELETQKIRDIFNYYKNDIFFIRPSYRKVGNQIKLIAGLQSAYTMTNKNIDTINSTFTPVPIFNVHNTNPFIHNRTEFEDALKKANQYLGTISSSPWPISADYFPDGIIWQENNTYFLYINIISQKVNLLKYVIKYTKGNRHNLTTQYAEQVLYKFEGSTPVIAKKFKKDNLYKYNFIYLDSIAFLSTELFNKSYNNGNGINDIINATSTPNKFEGKSLGSTLFNPITAFNAKHKNNNGVTAKIISKVSKTRNNVIKERPMNGNNQHNRVITTHKSKLQTKAKNNKVVNKQTGESSEMSEDLDAKFIKELEYLAYNSNPRLYYKLEDLINFHTAMKCNGLVVLAGLSGTGKSALIELYAKALGLTKNKNLHQFKFIPVRPFWNDDSDLLGYVDTVHSIYQPADSGLVNTLVEASKNPNHLYLITFDEMNLARVEYYFSQFLSILEKNPNNRYIQLYNPDLESRLYNSNKYKSKIKIGRNVLFTGTINLDESTHKFSDKVLDRSNIINLKLVPYYLDNQQSPNMPNRNPIGKEITPKDFDQMRICNSNNKLTTKDLKMLWELHKVLHQANNNLGIGRRIVNQINQYLCGIPKLNNEPLTHGKALDLQLVQRVFTKLRGSSADIGDILKPDNNHSNNLIHILNNYADISDFTESKNELKRKYNEVRNYGFTI